MSVIKKYQNPAGALPNIWEEWDKEASKVLGNLSFAKKRKKNQTSKEKLSAEQYAIAGMEKVKELIKGEGDNINNVVTWNRTAGTFDINLDKMKNQELRKKGIEYWSGSNNVIKPNMWGNLTTKDPGAYFGLAMGALQDFMENRNKPVVSTETSITSSNGTPVGLKSFQKLLKDEYPNVTDYTPLVIGKTNSETQENIKNLVKKHVTSYLTEANSNLTNKYLDKNNAEVLLNTINEGNWDKVNKELYKLGFDQDLYIKKPEQIEEETKVATAKQEEVDLENFRKNISKRGFDPNLIDTYPGYNKLYDENNIPERYKNVPNINDILKNSLLIHNPQYDQYKLINKDNSNDYFYTDPDANDGKTYGSAFTYEQGNLRFFNPQEYKEFAGTNNQFINNIPNNGLGDLRPIEGTIDGNELKIFGIPRSINGKVDYTTQLYIEDPNNPDKPLELRKEADGVYKDKNGTSHSVNIKGYGQYSGLITPHYRIKENLREGDILKNISEIESTKSVDNIINQLNLIPEIGEKTDLQRAKLIGELKYHINNNQWYSEANKASKKYDEILRYYEDTPNKKDLDGLLRSIKPRELSPLGRLVINMKPRIIYKEGGIIKLQKGDKLTWENYNKKYHPSKDVVNESTEPTKMKSIRGTWKDMNSLDKVSLAGAVTSFIPGVGAIGGAVTTLADVENDLERTGKINYGNLALNLGFTALGLVGLGGVGTAAKAARMAKLAGKTVDEVSDAVRIIRKVDKLKNVSTKTAEGLYKIAKGEAKSLTAAKLGKDSLNELKALGIKGLEKFKSPSTALKTPIINSITKSVKEIEKTEDLLKAEKAIPKSRTGLGKEFSGTLNAIENFGEWSKTHKFLGKATKIGLATPMVLGAVSSIPTAISDVSEGGFSNIQQKDLKNILFSAASVRGLLKNKQLANNINKLLGTQKEKAFMTIKGVKYPVKEELLKEFQSNVPKETKTLLNKVGLNKGKLKEVNNKKLKEFETYFEKYTGEKLPEGTTLEDISSNILSKNTFNTVSESGLSKSDYTEALKVIENKWKRRGLPTWYMKEGGTLKLQTGNKLSKPVDYTKKPKVKANKLNDISEYSTPILNTIMYGIGTINNSQINRKGNEAVLKGFTLEPMAKRRNIPLSTFNNFETEKEASKIDQLGRRIAESSSNLDQGLKARLAAHEQSSGLRLQGKLKDQEIINNLRREQFTSDATIDEYNLGATGRNMQRFGELNKNIALNQINKILSNNTNLQNFVTAQNEFIKNKREETQSKERDKLLANALMGSEYKKALADYTAFGGTDYLEKVKKEILNTPTVGEIKDYTSDQRWLDAVEKNKSTIAKFKAEQDRIQNLILMNRSFPTFSANDMNSYTTTKKRGGSLEDKLILEDKKLSGRITLENLKYKQKKALKEAEKAIKSISKNNELLQKSLIKIFK